MSIWNTLSLIAYIFLKMRYWKFALLFRGHFFFRHIFTQYTKGKSVANVIHGFPEKIVVLQFFTDLESYAKKMSKMFWVLTILFVNLMSSRLFPVFVYKICVQLPYYTSLWHFLFHRYDGFSFKLIFQKIQKLEVIFEIFCCGKILFNKMSFNFAI